MLDVSSVPVESSRLIKNACIEKWTKIYVKWKLVAGSQTDATIENRNIFGTENILRFIFFLSLLFAVSSDEWFINWKLEWGKRNGKWAKKATGNRKTDLLLHIRKSEMHSQTTRAFVRSHQWVRECVLSPRHGHVISHRNKI